MVKRTISVILAAVITAVSVTAVIAEENERTENISLTATASLYYNGEVKAELHNEQNQGDVEYFQANQTVNSSKQGGFAFSQFSLSDKQKTADLSTISKIEFSCYATGTPGGKYKIGEKQFNSADDFSSYAGSYLETQGYSSKALSKTDETVKVNDVTYTKYVADLTGDFSALKDKGAVTIALTSSSSRQSMLAYGSGYAPKLTITYGERKAVNTVKAVYKCGDDIIAERQLDTNSVYIGSSYTYTSPNYILGNDGKYYIVGRDVETDIAEGIFNDSSNGINKILQQTLTAEADTVVEYEVAESRNVIFYDEWENILHTNQIKFDDGRYYSSAGTMTAISGTHEFYQPEKRGYYQIIIVGGGKQSGTEIFRNKKAADAASVYGSGNAILGVKGTNQYYGIYSAKTVLLEDNDNLTVKGFGSDSMDYIVIRSVKEAEISGADGVTVLAGGNEAQYSVDTDIADAPLWSVDGITGRDRKTQWWFITSLPKVRLMRR